MAEELESIRERSSLMHEALTDLRAEQIDSRSLVISIVAMVFLPLTFITGLYGGMRSTIVNASIGGDPAPFRDCADSLAEIAQAWRTARAA